MEGTIEADSSEEDAPENDGPESNTLDEDTPDLDAPLELLSSISSRLLRGEIPTNPLRLQSLFEHIQSVVGDIVDASFAKITHAFDQFEEAQDAMGEAGADQETLRSFVEQFELGRDHVEESLTLMQESFFSAENFEDLEHFEEEFREAEVQLAEGLGRLEQAMLQADHPDLFKMAPDVASDELDEALEAFASGLESLSAHLEDGKVSHLEFALEKIEVARENVEKALEHAESVAEAEAEEEEDEQTELEPEEALKDS